MNFDFSPDNPQTASCEYSQDENAASPREATAPDDFAADASTRAPENAPCVLAIAGFDPSGGAGLFADARAMRAFGAHCCGALTAIVPQNTRGATRCEAVAPDIVAAQIDALQNDLPLRAIKIGLVPNATLAGLVATRVLAWREKNAAENRGGAVVLDTVFAPSSGAPFCDAATIQTIARRLFPLCDLVTPNLSEAATLSGLQTIEDEDAMREAARRIGAAYGAPRVLVKGGHLSGDALDVLYDAKTGNSEIFCVPRIPNRKVRGTGCLLASAIAAQLAQNIEMRVAIQRAKAWLFARIEGAQMLGEGHRIAM